MNSRAISEGLTANASSLFWPLFLLLAPLLWLQGKLARWRTPRLPAVVESNACSGPGEAACRWLLVLGESPAVGVGVDTPDQALPARIAAALSGNTGQHWHWHVLGENGASLARLLTILQNRQAPLRADCVVVVTGVNDCTGLTPRRRWRGQLLQLVTTVRGSTTAPIVFTPVPPIHCFTALPQPLRWIMGLRAGMLNADMQAVVAALEAVYRAPVLPPLKPEDLAADGFHPAASACSEWGRRMAQVITALPPRSPDP